MCIFLLCTCSVPANFVMGTRHIKEILESLFDEYNWLGDQWTQRNTTLQRALTYNLFHDETKKVCCYGVSLIHVIHTCCI